ncbi:flagellar biosynthesis protein FlhB [Vallitalea okinawensis]|uniref:flagellar biosynthesis protein FlhB n=1 Tax=Vallitalea okinawensis TaxID=2078660 RepID=UPI000CFB5EB2|nr:flagellar biosynthesis protein FlhB [Vallitalea okinawensis]
MKSYPIIAYNLQFFAKEGQGGEKTEKPTPKRRRKAREEGQVAKSNEISTALSFIAVFASVGIFIAYCFEKMKQVFYKSFQMFQYSETTDFHNPSFVSTFVSDAFKEVLLIVLPFMLVGFLVAFISSFIQVGWHPTLKPLKPNFGRLNPIKGLKRLFSLKILVELVKSVLKLTIIGFIIYSTLIDQMDLILNLFDYRVIEITTILIDFTVEIGLKVGVFYLVVAGIDYAYQKYEHEQNLKMTKQEIKEEYKMQEGNPEIKRKIRQKMREVSMRRMMQDLPKADVVITNPTHFAVAIKYDADVSTAPIVLAKGADLVAKRIREIATDHEIEIVENKPLARTLYYTVDIGGEIPPELYQAVAEVLAFVYRLKHKGV